MSFIGNKLFLGYLGGVFAYTIWGDVNGTYERTHTKNQRDTIMWPVPRGLGEGYLLGLIWPLLIPLSMVMWYERRVNGTNKRE